MTTTTTTTSFWQRWRWLIIALAIIAVIIIGFLLWPKESSAGTTPTQPTAAATSAPSGASGGSSSSGQSGSTGNASSSTSVWQMVVFPASDSRFNVTFDPFQGGSPDHPAYGWWHQVTLPAPSQRIAHTVPIIVAANTNLRFTGPACSVWWNQDASAAKSGQSGQLMLNHENVESGVRFKPTVGGEAKPNEAWIFVSCDRSDSSGFSFEALEPLPAAR